MVPAAPSDAQETAPTGEPERQAPALERRGAPPVADPWGTPGSGAPVLFVVEGIDDVVAAKDLQRKLAEALGRDLVSLVDARAHRAESVVWIGATDSHVVLRVTPPGRPEVWRQMPRAKLGPDPGAEIVRAVLEMFWVDHFARLDAAEVQDPFCPRGMICLDASRRNPWPQAPEVEVLDPWDTSYRRFYGFDPFVYNYPPSAALTAPQPSRQVRAPQLHDGLDGDEYRNDYAMDAVMGGGVHRGGAFVRYELDAVRRFPRFDFGLAFIGGRGQPEPASYARRAITAMVARRFLSPAFELDLGAAFGTFFATHQHSPVDVRPYLRGNAKFALPLGPTFDMLVQSDLGTTFISVSRTGVVEYALSLGLRHRM